MPCLKICTSLARDKIPENFVYKIIPVLARTVRKPEDKFKVLVSPDCIVGFSGVHPSTPCAIASLESIGHLGLEENKVIAREVTDFIQKELGILPEHLFLSFYDLRGQDIATGGVTMV